MSKLINHIYIELKGGKMRVEVVEKNGYRIALVNSDEIVISDVQSALDFIMTVNYEADSRNIVLNKEAISEDFFVLSTRLAGEILQKFINYGVRFAVYGDFSGYTSKPLKDFMYESNKGKDFYFQSDVDSAINKLAYV